MTSKIILPSGMEAVEAKYSEFPIEEYNSNPFIQALPPLGDTADTIKKLMMNPSFSEDERNLDSNIRLHLVHRLYQFFQPLPIHVRIANMIQTTLMQGYLARNPFDKDYRSHVSETGKKIINRVYDIHSVPNFRTTASCGTIMGFSGMGKTTTVNRVLSHIPQIIVHNEYNAQPFLQIQVAWMKIEAPHNSSLKALCLQFFMKADELLGTNNFKKHVSRNLSVDAMVPLMGQVAQNIGLGVLIIDEIQHLVNRNATQIMNFFVSLINSFGLPLVIIGTPASQGIFDSEFRISRRVSGNGAILWNNMEKSQEFQLFLEGIWRYQWNRKYTPLTQEFVQVMYEETQGISDLICKCFLNAQRSAMESGKEELTVELMKKVAREEFKLMRPFLDALKSGNPYKVAKYADITKLEFRGEVEGIVQSVTKQTPEKVVHKREVDNTPPITRQTSKSLQEYSENDLRRIPPEAKRRDVSPYQLLLERGYIEDMSEWEETSTHDELSPNYI